MKVIKIAIFSATGMLGSNVLKYLIYQKFGTDYQYEIYAFSRQSNLLNDLNKHNEFINLDFTKESIRHITHKFDYVINCCGLIKQKINEENNQDILDSIYINSVLPYILVTKFPEAKVIQPLTDCEYNSDTGNLNELTKPNPSDIYGITKSLAAKIVAPNFIGLRASIIGLELNGQKSLMSWFYNLPLNAKVLGWSQSKWNGIGCVQWAEIVHGIMQNNIEYPKVQNIIPANSVSKYELLNIFREIFNRKDIIIDRVDGEMTNRTLSTINLEMNKTLWENAGYKVIPTIEYMVRDQYIFNS